MGGNVEQRKSGQVSRAERTYRQCLARYECARAATRGVASAPMQGRREAGTGRGSIIDSLAGSAVASATLPQVRRTADGPPTAAATKCCVRSSAQRHRTSRDAAAQSQGRTTLERLRLRCCQRMPRGEAVNPVQIVEAASRGNFGDRCLLLAFASPGADDERRRAIIHSSAVYRTASRLGCGLVTSFTSCSKRAASARQKSRRP
jgi:hypothetical protein